MRIVDEQHHRPQSELPMTLADSSDLPHGESRRQHGFELMERQR